MQVWIWIGILMAGPTLQEMKGSCDKMNKGKNSFSFFPHINCSPHTNTEVEVTLSTRPDLQWVVAATETGDHQLSWAGEGIPAHTHTRRWKAGVQNGLHSKVMQNMTPKNPCVKAFHSTAQCKRHLTPAEDPWGSSHSPFPSHGQQNQS